MKLHSVFICQQCGFKSSSYFGKCPQCDTWNSFVEEVEEGNRLQVTGSSKKHPAGKIEHLKDVDQAAYPRIPTTISEFDRVLGGGIVKGSVILVSGDPGVGKSTLLTQLAINNNSCLYVAGEESAQQIKIRSMRINPKANFPVLNETNVDIISATIEEIKPTVVIVDSVQTLSTEDLSSAAGSVSQVRECATRLQKVAKRLHIPILLVGHVTKDGSVAGPKTLEHLVDVVLSLEGDSTTNFRILRSIKNRFGSTDEVGIFDMLESGMKEVVNPSEVFLESHTNSSSVSGAAIVPILSGLRPILLEIQALVTKTSLPMPRRTGSGIDNNRLQLLVAVLQKRLKLPLWDADIFVNVTGGVKVIDPAADLAICMAIYSSFKDLSLPKASVFIGEVGLLGELRGVNQLEKRLKEAAKLGYKHAFSPQNYKTLSEIVDKL